MKFSESLGKAFEIVKLILCIVFVSSLTSNYENGLVKVRLTANGNNK